MKRNGQYCNLETVVRIFKALGYTLDIRPKSIKVDKKPAVSTLGPGIKPPFSFTGTPATLSNNKPTPTLTKGPKI